MDNTTVFSKTGKGLLEVKNRSNRISKEQYRVLSLIDGKANLDELADRARMNPTGLRTILTQLTDGGYVKVLVSSTTDDVGLGTGAATGSYYVDDLDFTAVLGPAGKPRASIYQSTETERRQRESAERKAAEAAATKRREEEERRKQADAARLEREAAAGRQLREEAERKARLAAQRETQLEAELRARLDNDRKAKEAAAAKARSEADAKLKADLDRQIREANLQKQREEQREAEARKRQAEEEQIRREAALAARREAEERARQEAEARRRKEEEQRLRREAEEKARIEAEARRRQEEEARKRKEEEERLRLEAEERARSEAQARQRREEEERLRQAAEEKARREAEARQRKEEEERLRREEAERLRREAEEKARIEAEERRRREEEARKRKEEEERLRREAEEKARIEAEERRRQEEEARKRKEEEERLRREAEEKARIEAEERRRQEEEARKRKEEEERLRREAEEKIRQQQEIARQEQERIQREQTDAIAEQKRLEEEVRKRKSEKQRQRDPRPDEDFGDLAASAGGGRPSDEDSWLLREIGVTTHTGLGAVGERQAPIQPSRASSGAASKTVSHDLTSAFDTAPEELVATHANSVLQEDSAGDGEGEDLLSMPALPDVVEDVAMFAPAPDAFDPGVKEPAGVVMELDIRRALEEQERRLRMEDEARAALERAERAATEKAEREARELAEAEERARKADAIRAREEADRLAREEKERRELEEEEQRRQREVDRRAREQARQEAERRKREEDLARQRKEQEEREQRKAERDRVHKEIRRAHVTPMRVMAAAAALLVVLAAAVVQFASLSAWAPDIERIATQRVGEPVRIGSVRANLLPEFQLVLEGVTVGVAQDVHANTVVLSPQIGSLFAAQKALDEIHVKGVTGSVEALARAGGWLNGQGAKVDLVSVPIVKVSDLTLTIPGVTLPNVNVTFKLGQGGTLLGAFAATSDEHLEMDFLPRESDVEVSIRGRNFTMPVGPAVEVMDLQGKGTLVQGAVNLTKLEYFLLGGQGTAELSARWTDGWYLETQFDLQRMSLDASMRALKIQLVSEGSLDAKGVARMRSQKFETLFEKPEVSASFTVSRGNLAGVDLPRALQQRSREGVQGGQTRFEELSGVLQTREGSYQYRSLKLQAGVLKAAGQADITAAGVVSGRVQSELRSSAGQIRGAFTLSGNDQAMLLKQ